ncbi:unnamed protein product [Closterium sp. NIES-54]
MSSQQLREWLVRRAHRRSGAPEAREAGNTGAGGAAVTTGAGGTGGTAASSPGGARTSGAGAAGTGGVGCAGAGDPTEPGAAHAGGTGIGGPSAGGAGAAGVGVGGTGVEGAGAAGAGAVDPGAGGARDTVRPRPYFVPLLQQPQLPLHPSSPLLAPSPYTEESGGLTERREPAYRPVSPVRTAHRAPRSRPPPVPGMHTMALCPSSVPLLAESVPASPPSVGGECALGTDVLEDRQEDFECLAAAVPRFASMLLAPKGDPDAPDIPTPRSYAEAITGPYSSQWQAAMDADMASWRSTGTYVDAVPPSRANIVDGMWIFRVKRPPGSPPAFKARYVARGFSALRVARHTEDYTCGSWVYSFCPSAPATAATATAAPSATTATATAATATATAAIAAPACCATMALLRVLTFDHEGRPFQFDTWLNDLQLYLLSDSKDIVSLFDLASGAATAPPATADSATRSQWLTRDAATRLAICNHLPLAECAHFG